MGHHLPTDIVDGRHDHAGLHAEANRTVNEVLDHLDETVGTRAELEAMRAEATDAAATALAAAADATAPTEQAVANALAPGKPAADTLNAAIEPVTDPLSWLKAKRAYRPYLSKWATALAAVRAGTGNATILCVGDSTTHGVGDGATTFLESASWPARLVEAFNDRFAPAAHGFAAPPSAGAGYPDNRWTVGAGWFNGSAGEATRRYGVPSRVVGCASGSIVTATTFNDPRVLADTFDIYYVRQRRSSTTATFIAQATGGTAVETSIAGLGHPDWPLDPDIRKVTVTAGSASTTNVVSLSIGTAAASQFIVLGIVPRLSTASRVMIGNAGSGGTTSQSWVNVPTDDPVVYGGVGGPRMIKAVAPDLTIIDLGINDANPVTLTPPATYAANIVQLVDAAKVSGDVLLKTPVPSQGRDMSAYLAQLRAIDAPLWDGYAFYGSWAEMDAKGFMADTLHPSAAGYVDVAKRMQQVLANVR